MESTIKNTGGLAFPRAMTVSHGAHADHQEVVPPEDGMFLRDYFAAKAIQGLLANPGGPIQANGMRGWNWCNCSPEDAANLAYCIADAMLAQREKE